MPHPLRTISSLALAALLPALTGCLNSIAPHRPQTLAPTVAAYAASDYKADVARYRSAISEKDYTQARALRDQIVYRTLADIESQYGHFEQQLTVNRASENLLADTAQLGLTAATTVVSAGDIKDILAASLSGLQGTQLSIDKNFFREKTTESLISQMRADRKNLQAQIISRLATQDVIPTTDAATKANVPAYALEAAWIDVTQYYYAGTVPSALVSIASNTGDAATKAQANLTTTIQSLKPATAAQAQASQNISKKLNALYNAALHPNTKAGADAITSLRGILTAIGRPAADGAPLDTLMQAITQARADASATNPNRDAALSAKIEAAFANFPE